MPWLNKVTINTLYSSNFGGKQLSSTHHYSDSVI